MLSVNAVQIALKAHLEPLVNPNGGTFPINWPNQVYDGSLSYVDCDIVFTGSTNDVLSGDDSHDFGYVAFVAVTPAGISTELAFTMMDAVRSKFKKGDRVQVPGGHILITGNVESIATGYQTDSDWRLPFQVTFQTS